MTSASCGVGVCTRRASYEGLGKEGGASAHGDYIGAPLIRFGASLPFGQTLFPSLFCFATFFSPCPHILAFPSYFLLCHIFSSSSVVSCSLACFASGGAQPCLWCIMMLHHNFTDITSELLSHHASTLPCCSFWFYLSPRVLFPELFTASVTEILLLLLQIFFSLFHFMKERKKDLMIQP